VSLIRRRQRDASHRRDAVPEGAARARRGFGFDWSLTPLNVQLDF
jgi:hypothetical protein